MTVFQEIATHYNYAVTIFLMASGLYIVVARGNMIKKLIGLALFQTSVYLLYLSAGKIVGGTAPIIVADGDATYSNPLPHVLMLTAIVVGVAVQALGLALAVRIYEAYGTIEEEELFGPDAVADKTQPTGSGSKE
ncbi:MAG: cation:proton antiporter subunit C [Pseudomonadota bacterium]